MTCNNYSTSRENGLLTLPNPHLGQLERDGLFHIQVPLDDLDTLKEFSNVKFVCIGGTAGRLKLLAQTLATELDSTKTGEDGDQKNNFDFSFETERYSGFKVGPVFCVNHGIGMPSVSIMLHEVFKLLQRAGCSGVTLIRVGTCGGIGIDPGTVVVSNGALTSGLKEVYVTSALGKPLELPVHVEEEVVDDLCSCASNGVDKDLNVVAGKTYCTDDFYQGQGRLDGSFCDYSENDRLDFLKELHSLGVRNIEMESAAVFAMAHKVGVKAAVVCVVLVNRLETDLPELTEKEHAEIQTYPIQLVTRYIKKQISKSQ